MRTSQITLRFGDDPMPRQVWVRLPAAERAQIARLYARLLTKAAKVDRSELEQNKQEEL